MTLRRSTAILLVATATIALFTGGAVGAVVADGTHAETDGTAPLAQDDPLVEPCAAEIPEDYEDPEGGTTETIGWVDGYWYDEPVDVNATDGLSEAELDRLSARTAARVEAMRCLTFEDGLPPIEVRTREEHANWTDARFANVSEDLEQVENARLSTLLVVGDDTDAVNETSELFATGVGGFYQPSEEYIVVIKPDDGSTQISELTLFEELGHALQDQQFNLSRDFETTDRENAWTGLVEGDINLLDQRFLQRCAAERWSEPCMLPRADGDDGEADTGPSNWGIYFEFQYPYLEGPAFVQETYEAGGWEAVNELYDDVPESTATVTAPEAAADAEFVDPEVVVEPAGEWEQVTDPNGSDTDELGHAWIASTTMAPSWEDDVDRGIVDPNDHVHYDEDGELEDIGGVTYDPEPAMGWRGDRIAYYERGNDTATVWMSAWADESEAAEFASAYEDLLEIRGASTTEEHANVYGFAEDSGYEGAVALKTDGDRVRIVHAPSVDALTTVAPDVEFETADGTDSGEGSGTDNESAGENESTGENGDESAGGEDSLPGFGVGAALVAALLGAALLDRRER